MDRCCECMGQHWGDPARPKCTNIVDSYLDPAGRAQFNSSFVQHVQRIAAHYDIPHLDMSAAVAAALDRRGGAGGLTRMQVRCSAAEARGEGGGGLGSRG